MTDHDPMCWRHGGLRDKPPIPETHDGLAADLAEFLVVRLEMLTWQNIEVGYCRPDVYALMPTLNIDNLRPTSFEVKMSRADVMRDRRESKWRGYRSFSKYVAFACVRGLITVDDLPKEAGLWVRDEEGWHKLRQGRANHDWDLGRRNFMKLINAGRDTSLREIVNQRERERASSR